MAKAIRILVVDDQPIVREGLQSLLSREEDMEVVGVGDGNEALAQVADLSPDIVLMDIKMPGVDGIECTRRIKNKFTSCRIIMLSLYDEYLTEAMEAGASGYLLKDTNRAEITQAIRDVHLGQVVISGGIPASSRFEYERRFEDKSAGDDILRAVQLVMPPPIDAMQLMEFIQRVDEVLGSRMVQMVGSVNDGTVITLSLIKPTSLADILNKLREMPEVAEIVEKIPAQENLLGLLKKAVAIRRLKPCPQKSILVTLKQDRRFKLGSYLGLSALTLTVLFAVINNVIQISSL
ncbi:hypothetical protein LCGC14_0262350 [marine sediment metagenome]|uniref:Response regulatory domain-containing protein n=1 Tax=marine sediment metagenome TaxID=412755 RepID=A0A0F9WLP4_9ZZZZ